MVRRCPGAHSGRQVLLKRERNMRIQLIWQTPVLVLFLVGCGDTHGDTDAHQQPPRDQQGPGDRSIEEDSAALQRAEDTSLRHVRTVQPELLAGVDAVQKRRVIIDKLGMSHTRLTETFQGIPVWGGEAIVHLRADGSFESMTDTLVRDINVDTHPSLSDVEAIGRALDACGGSTSVTGTPKADLWIFRKDDVDHLAYRVRIDQLWSDGPAMPTVFVDAHSGEVIEWYDNLKRVDSYVCADAADPICVEENYYPVSEGFYGSVANGNCMVRTYSGGQWTSLRNPSGSIKVGTMVPHSWCANGWGCDLGAGVGITCRKFPTDVLTWRLVKRDTFAADTPTLPGTLERRDWHGLSSDPIVNMAHDNAGLVSSFYDIHFGRDSYDNSGATIRSSVGYGVNYVNAYWNGTQLVFGNGDGVVAGPLAVLDVVAHELTHAVTETTSNLIYSNESGSLDEAISDITAAATEAYRDGAVSAHTWKIGEEFFTPGIGGDAVRHMNDPALGGDRDFYPDRYTGSGDNGGVHYNSGIANLAFYLMVAGGQHPRGKTSNVVPPLNANDSYDSIMKGAIIFYRANTVYLMPSSTFASARVATKQAALDLYGSGAASSVEAAWDAVGVAAPVSWTVLGTESNLSGGAGSQVNFSYVTPSGSKGMKFNMSGGSGDADLYVKFGNAPTTQSYDCRPYKAGNAESCTFPPQQGTYYVMIRGYSSYSGVTLSWSSGQ